MSFPSILLVSGDEAVRRELQSLMTQDGTELPVAGSLSEAVQRAKLEQPDIVLIDARMPDLDFKGLLAPAEGKRPPVVLLLLEGLYSGSQEQAWRADGAAGFIVAPFEPATFARRVHELVEQAWFSRKLADLAELGGPPFVSEMIDAFLTLATQAIADIRAGLASGDLPAVARTAHSLKSAAANLGAEELREIAVQIESQARSSETSEGLQPYFGKLATSLDRARDFLQRHRSLQS